MEAQEIETRVGELETNVDRLRALYEQYFMGIERIAPSVVHKDVERRIYTLRKEQIRNTAVRFRFQMIIQRYNTYQTHWQRICRQIEEGTYKRDRLRAERRMVAAAAQQAPPEQPQAAPDPAPAPAPPQPHPPPVRRPSSGRHKLELDDLDEFSNLDLSGALGETRYQPPPMRPPAASAPAWRKVTAGPPATAAAAPPPPKPVAPPPAPPAPPLRKPPPPLPPRVQPSQPQGLSEERMKQIYDKYVQTRQAQKETTAAMSFDAMAKTLRESSAKLRSTHGNVDYEVAVKDGKTILRAVVKK